MLFVEQNMTFNKNETESKMKNNRHTFREMNLTPHARISNLK